MLILYTNRISIGSSSYSSRTQLQSLQQQFHRMITALKNIRTDGKIHLKCVDEFPQRLSFFLKLVIDWNSDV